MKESRFRGTAAGLILFLLTLCGCIAGNSAPSKFFLLSPMADATEGRRAADTGGCVAVGVGPVRMPAYLDRPEIATRLSSNELQFADFNRWAEPLEDNFTRVFSENLAGFLCTQPVTLFPWKSYTPLDYQVVVDVIQMDGALGGSATMVVRWAVLGAGDKDVLLSKRSTYREAVGAEGYEALVAAESRLVIAFSREVAAALAGILKRTPLE